MWSAVEYIFQFLPEGSFAYLCIFIIIMIPISIALHYLMGFNKNDE